MSNFIFSISLVLFLSTFLPQKVFAANYVCTAWRYDDGSSNNKIVKLKINDNTAEINGTPYVMRGYSFDIYGVADEIFMTLNRDKMDGWSPIRTYHVILAPCKGRDDYSHKKNGEYSFCKNHEMVRFEDKVHINWEFGMQKSNCEIF